MNKIETRNFDYNLFRPFDQESIIELKVTAQCIWSQDVIISCEITSIKDIEGSEVSVDTEELRELSEIAMDIFENQL